MTYYVYILASRKHGSLYIGVTNDIARRVWEHRQGLGSRFVERNRVTRLVHVEPHEDIERAIQREKTLKEWPRVWKVRLIERGNPDLEDLYDRLNGQGIGSRQRVPGRHSRGGEGDVMSCLGPPRTLNHPLRHCPSRSLPCPTAASSSTMPSTPMC